MSHQFPPGKVAIASQPMEWRERMVTTRGIRFGGVWFWHPTLQSWAGFSMEVRPIGAQTLQARISGTEDVIEFFYIDAAEFEDPDAVDAFLELRSLIPRPPYKSFFSTTQVVFKETTDENR